MCRSSLCSRILHLIHLIFSRPVISREQNYIKLHATTNLDQLSSDFCRLAASDFVDILPPFAEIQKANQKNKMGDGHPCRYINLNKETVPTLPSFFLRTRSVELEAESKKREPPTTGDYTSWKLPTRPQLERGTVRCENQQKLNLLRESTAYAARIQLLSHSY